MPDEIPPAVTAEEWDKWWRGDRWIELGRQPNRRFGVDAHRYRNDPRPAATMAFANAAREDTDPGKFTHDDVQTLAEVIGYLESEGRHHEDVDAIVAKLLAILPPGSAIAEMS